MKMIVAGGRNFNNYTLLEEELDYLYGLFNSPLEVVCGEARGADSLGKRWGLENSLTVHSFPADWEKHGKSAGYVRNAEMADFANSLVAFWDGKSKGTKMMIDLALKKGLLVMVVRY